jgi:hypothetical protein
MCSIPLCKFRGKNFKIDSDEDFGIWNLKKLLGILWNLVALYLFS